MQQMKYAKPKTLIGKTIMSVSLRRDDGAALDSYVRIAFTDGTGVVIEASIYECVGGNSDDMPGISILTEGYKCKKIRQKRN